MLGIVINKMKYDPSFNFESEVTIFENLNLKSIDKIDLLIINRVKTKPCF